MQIILGKPWTDTDGKEYSQGTVLEVDEKVARELTWDDIAKRHRGTELVDKTDEQPNTEGYMQKLSDEQMRKIIKESVVQALETATGKTKDIRQAETDEEFAACQELFLE